MLGTRLGETSGRKWKKTSFFSRDSDAPFAPKSEDSRLVWGQNLDWEKLWRGQVFGGQVQERLMLQVCETDIRLRQTRCRRGSFWTRIRGGSFWIRCSGLGSSRQRQGCRRSRAAVCGKPAAAAADAVGLRSVERCRCGHEARCLFLSFFLFLSLSFSFFFRGGSF